MTRPSRFFRSSVVVGASLSLFACGGGEIDGGAPPSAGQGGTGQAGTSSAGMGGSAGAAAGSAGASGSSAGSAGASGKGGSAGSSGGSGTGGVSGTGGAGGAGKGGASGAGGAGASGKGGAGAGGAGAGGAGAGGAGAGGKSGASGAGAGGASGFAGAGGATSCVQCATTSCAPETKACKADAQCASCLADPTQAPCIGYALLVALDACVCPVCATECAAQCGTGTGGAAGMGGAAGTGGAAGGVANDTCASVGATVSIPPNMPTTVVASDTFDGANDDLQGSCFVGTTVDKVYAVSPAKSGPLTISATATGVFPAIYVHSPDCATGPEIACTASAKVTFVAKGGDTYFIVVEGAGAMLGNSMTLTAESVPPGPASECTATPATLPAKGVGKGFSGDTSAGAADATVPTGAGQCDAAAFPNPSNGLDQTLLITPGVSGTLLIQLDPDPGSQLIGVVYVEATCHDETTSLACAAGAKVGDSVPLTVPVTGGMTYSIIVDSVGAASGPYSIAVLLQ